MQPLHATPDTFCSEIYVEEAPTRVTNCKTCGKLFNRGDIRITLKRHYSKSHYFHLDCFKPVTNVRIRPEDVIINGKNDCVKGIIENWVRDWNRKFTFDDKKVQIYTEKRVKSDQPSNRRALLECFKFLDVKSVVLTVGFVCKSWHYVAWEDELWYFSGKIDSNSRKSYILSYFHSCAHCNTPLCAETIHAICPLTNKPKCIQCYSVRENRPQRLNWIKTEFNVNPGRLKKLGVKTFVFDGVECTYLWIAEEIVAKHRKIACELIGKRENSEKLWGKRCVDVLNGGNLSDFGLFGWEGKRLLFEYQRKLYDFVSSTPKSDEVEKFLREIDEEL